MHLPPTTDLSQIKAKGVHWRKTVTTKRVSLRVRKFYTVRDTLGVCTHTHSLLQKEL